jgi:hypothetical protein
METRPFPRASFFADDLANSPELLRHLLVCRYDIVESVSDLSA